jgi:twitching motility protein PilT
MDFAGLFKKAFEVGASDVHLRAGRAAQLRVGGRLVTVDGGPVGQEELLAQVERMVPGHLRGNVMEEAASGLDFAYTEPAAGRFRCSAFRALGRVGMTMRTIRAEIPTLESLNLPPVIMEVALSRRGLTLVAGTTGSGKSTTLAAIVGVINQNYDVKVITVEDPIEFVHEDARAAIAQVEVGIDSVSFDRALRQALRQDPDVILVGELRDAETLRTALRAADTGHQVFATVHAGQASLTVERVIAMFPAGEHKVLLGQLAHNLEAIVAQRLVMTTDGKSRRAVVEVLRGGPVAEKFILEGKFPELNAYMEEGERGMQSFDQHLLSVWHERVIGGTEALRNATRPEKLAAAMHGIRFSGMRSGGGVTVEAAR